MNTPSLAQSIAFTTRPVSRGGCCFPQEMGLGKTVEMLGCILANPYRPSVGIGHSTNSEEEEENPRDGDRDDEGDAEVDMTPSPAAQTSKSGENLPRVLVLTLHLHFQPLSRPVVSYHVVS